MKHCPFCAEEIQDAAVKCKHCGSMLNQPPPVSQNAATGPPPAGDGSKRSWLHISPVLAGVVIVLAGGFFVVRAISGSNDNVTSSASGSTAANAQSSSTRASAETVRDETVEVKEDQYLALGFVLKRSAQVSVHLERKSGPHFEFYVMRESELANWRAAANGNSREFRYLPDLSGARMEHFTNGGLLNAGKYYLVIDNSDVGDVAPPMNMSDDKLRVKVRITAK